MGQRNRARPGEVGLEAATETSRLTAVVDLRGARTAVLEQAIRLLQLVAQELPDATLSRLQVEHDAASAPAYLVERGAGDELEVVGRGVASPEEATLWQLALRAAGTGDRDSENAPVAAPQP